MYILGIESSCDETAVAVIERGERNRVIDEQIKSQISIHAKYGGVVPEIASRSHYEVIDYLTNEALKKAGITIKDIGLIALTQGPGLMGSLLVGLSFAKGLAYANNIPLVGVDHILAHIEAAFIEEAEIQYPLLALVVSGGHTTIFHQESKFDTLVVAKTRDDAVGEVMDKTAKFFGLGYPGGPILDKHYSNGDRKRFRFTRPKIRDGSNDFSFSGYKTGIIRHPDAKGIDTGSVDFKDLISSFVYSTLHYLLHKTKAAMEERPIKSLIVSGGVSRNSMLREMFQSEFGAGEGETDVKLYLAAPQYCTDNASMIAWLGYEKYRAFPDENYFDPYLNAYSRATFKTMGKHR